MALLMGLYLRGWAGMRAASSSRIASQADSGQQRLWPAAKDKKVGEPRHLGLQSLNIHRLAEIPLLHNSRMRLWELMDGSNV